MGIVAKSNSLPWFGKKGNDSGCSFLHSDLSAKANRPQKEAKKEEQRRNLDKKSK